MLLQVYKTKKQTYLQNYDIKKHRMTGNEGLSQHNILLEMITNQMTVTA